MMTEEIDVEQIRQRQAELRATGAAVYEEASRLQDILDGPRVVALAHYHRYHAPYVEECDSLEDAFLFLKGGEDYGNLYGDYISVGGARYGFDYVHDKVIAPEPFELGEPVDLP